MAGTSFQFAGVSLPIGALMFDDNFGEGRTSIMQMPGLNGGFNNNGSAPARHVPGVVRLSFTLVAETRADMQALRDAINALWSLGQRVLMQTLPDSSKRWCAATVTNISMPQDPSGQTDLFQPVSMVFGVDTPGWKAVRAGDAFWDDGEAEWDTSGDYWDGKTVTANNVLGGNSFTIDVSGGERTLPRLVIRCASYQSVFRPKWEHIHNGKKHAEFYYNGTVGNSSELEINCQTLAVWLDGVAAYGDMVWTKQDEQWMYLYSGENLVRVSWPSSQAATALVIYEEVYL